MNRAEVKEEGISEKGRRKRRRRRKRKKEEGQG